MRTPTPLRDQMRWHRDALLDAQLHPLERPTHSEIVEAIREGKLTPLSDGDYQVGWYKTKLVKGGPWVPARVWLEQDIDPDTGELMSDEVFRCEVNGREVDPGDWWLRLCGNPITHAEYDRRKAHRDDIGWNERTDDPVYDPRQTIDFQKLPFPEFGK